MMQVLDKQNIYILRDLLEEAGVRDVVISPGSRNAAINLVLASAHNANGAVFRIHVIIDERTAAFAALGMASKGTPVALVCTSGTAVLNYGPAVAEAYYRRVPLIVISADRPNEAIDQRDSQTIRQYGVLANYVRKSVEVSEDISAAVASRIINDAIAAASGNIPGPVHINMPLRVPLTAKAEQRIPRARLISTIRATEPNQELTQMQCHRIAKSKKVMIVAGSSRPITMPAAIGKARNVVIVAEVNANLRGATTISPSVFDRTKFEREYAPEVVINFGGALISDSLKGFMRKHSGEVISVGYDDNIVDTFGKLSTRIEIEPQKFFYILAEQIFNGESDYKELWENVELPTIPDRWCDAKAIEMLCKATDERFNVFIGNGMSIRYSQLCRWNAKEIFSNRGVSGIDGCTSTATGIAIASGEPTLLISGDMSAAYDIGALSIPEIGSNLKIAIIDNHGGDIFRRVKTTQEYANDFADIIIAEPKLPLKSLADAYGFNHYECTDIDSGSVAIEDFMKDQTRPAILHVKTTAEANNEAYNLIYNEI